MLMNFRQNEKALKQMMMAKVKDAKLSNKLIVLESVQWLKAEAKSEQPFVSYALISFIWQIKRTNE